MGFFGYDYDRKIALRALAVSAAKSDVHSIFAGYGVGLNVLPIGFVSGN